VDSVSAALGHLAQAKRLRKLRDEWSRSSPAASPEDVPPLAKFVPQVTPEFAEPTHLAPLIDVLERATREPIRICVSVPPRHGKSETVFHWIAWLLLQEPRLRVAYVTYAHTFAAEQVEKARRVAERAGVQLGAADRAGFWDTAAGGSVTGESVQGQLTGRGFHIIVVDDPHKSRAEAESGTIRRRVVTGFEGDILTRQEPAGTSVVVVHTRWHVNDLIGHLVKNRDWQCVNLPAINDKNEALAPWLWPVEKLNEFRSNEYDWWSLYMGHPRARGAEVFGGPATCKLAEVPKGRAAIGIDLAYTKKTSSDHSIALVLVHGGQRPLDGKPVYYVANVIRKQCRAPDFGMILKGLRATWPGTSMTWHCAGTERGSADFLIDSGIPLIVRNAGVDKFVRAQPAADAWNDGRIIVPSDAPWSDRFIEVVTSFTGLDDDHDDDVDALSSAFDGVTRVQVGFGHVKGL
jgi:phage terminase large subunit-like protein